MTTADATPIWFEAVSPHLLRNKAIRNFLNHYNGRDWPEAVKLSMLYGILALQKRYAGQLLPIEQLRSILTAGQTALAVEGALPELQDKLEGLQAQLADVTDGLSDGKRAMEPMERKRLLPPPENGGLALAVLPPVMKAPALRKELAEADVKLRHLEMRLPRHGALPIAPQHMPRKVANTAARVVALEHALSPGRKPTSDWRDGDQHRTWSPPGKRRSPILPGEGAEGPYYPAWWGDGHQYNAQLRHARSRSAPRPGRAPPRLAYPVFHDGEDAQPIWKDDLVTARYLDVPSSGYGRPGSPPALPPGFAPPTSEELNAPLPYAWLNDGQQPALPQQQQQYPAPPGGGYGPQPHGGLRGAAQPPAQPQQQPQQPFVPFAPLREVYAGARAREREHAQQGRPQPGQLYMVQPSGAMVPVGPQKKEPWKRISTAPQSKIRVQVEADKQAARMRQMARARAAQLAVQGGGGNGAGLERWGGGGGGAEAYEAQRPAGSARSARGPVSDVADSLQSNPYTSWFVGDAGGDAAGGPPAAAAQPQPPAQAFGLQADTAWRQQQNSGNVMAGLGPPSQQQQQALGPAAGGGDGFAAARGPAGAAYAGVGPEAAPGTGPLPQAPGRRVAWGDTAPPASDSGSVPGSTSAAWPRADPSGAPPPPPQQHQQRPQYPPYGNGAAPDPWQYPPPPQQQPLYGGGDPWLRQSAAGQPYDGPPPWSGWGAGPGAPPAQPAGYNGGAPWVRPKPRAEVVQASKSWVGDFGHLAEGKSRSSSDDRSQEAAEAARFWAGTYEAGGPRFPPADLSSPAGTGSSASQAADATSAQPQQAWAQGAAIEVPTAPSGSMSASSTPLAPQPGAAPSSRPSTGTVTGGAAADGARGAGPAPGAGTGASAGASRTDAGGTAAVASAPGLHQQQQQQQGLRVSWDPELDFAARLAAAGRSMAAAAASPGSATASFSLGSPGYEYEGSVCSSTATEELLRRVGEGRSALASNAGVHLPGSGARAAARGAEQEEDSASGDDDDATMALLRAVGAPAAAMRAEREWQRTMQQVAHLTLDQPGPAAAALARATVSGGGSAGGGGMAAGAGAGGTGAGWLVQAIPMDVGVGASLRRRWDMDDILGQPASLTYQR